MAEVVRTRAVRQVARVAVAVAVLAAPAFAAAADFAFTGRGFGHGVGLPQYGARGAALVGWDERRILAHFYRGTTLERVETRGVRVLLRSRKAGLQLRGPLVARMNGARVRVPRGRVRARAHGRDVVLLALDGREIARSRRAVTLSSARGVFVGGARYRGRVRLAAPRPGVLEAVNVLGLEQYLRGVVPGEIPASWGDDAPAALRAQAIAARSYALATIRRGGRFDLFSDTRSQVYKGISVEDRRTDAAIRATARQVVTHRGRPIVAFFSSSSGGRTATSSTGFGGADQPYLVSVRDPFDRRSPHHRWREPVVVSGEDLAGELGLEGAVTSLRVLERGTSPRVKRVEVRTADGERVERTGAEIRTAAGLRSTWFSVTRRGASKTAA